MKTIHTEVTILDFCRGLETGEYEVNKDYQRSDKVWPEPAKSFLIETILLDYPVPKLSIHQNLDLKSMRTVKQIVDGQQRSAAIRQFFNNRLRLGRNLQEDFAGRTFAELEDQYQASFLNYSLSFDLFVGATVDEVREVFRRMNSFTIPLNAEESRHATYQGEFKWYINALSKIYSDPLETAGVFNAKQLNRMQDAKLLTELSHAILKGISTTNKSALDNLYKTLDKTFDEREPLSTAVTAGLDAALFHSEVRNTGLAKPLNFYALTLSYVHRDTSFSVIDNPTLPLVSRFEPNSRLFNLNVLAEALDSTEGDLDPELRPFVAAAKDRTNVREQRETRFLYFLAAITK